MKAEDEDGCIYALEKILETLPGKQAEIYKELSALLKDPNAEVAAERASCIKHLRYYLEDKNYSKLVRGVIQAKLNAFVDPPISRLPTDALRHIFSFFLPSERLQLTSVCKKWRAVAQDRNYWLNKLVQVTGVSTNRFADLVEPHGVYQRFIHIKLISRKISGIDFQSSSQIKFSCISLSCYVEAFDSIKGIHKHFTLENKRDWDTNERKISQLLTVVLLTGRLSVVQYLTEMYNIHPDIDSLNCSAISGNLSLIKHLVDKYGLTPNELTLNYAAVSGNLSSVEYLVDTHDLKPSEFTLNCSAVSGNLPLVTYLVATHGLKPNEVTFICSAVSGNLPLVTYLVDAHGLKPNELTLNYAVVSGNLCLMQYLIKKYGLKLDKDTLKIAFAQRDLSVVRYLIKTFDLKPDKDMLKKAIQSGDLFLVQYLIETHRLIPDRDALHAAALTFAIDIVRYLIEKCHVIPDDDMRFNVNGLYSKFMVYYINHMCKIDQRISKIP